MLHRSLSITKLTPFLPSFHYCFFSFLPFHDRKGQNKCLDEAFFRVLEFQELIKIGLNVFYSLYKILSFHFQSSIKFLVSQFSFLVCNANELSFSHPSRQTFNYYVAKSPSSHVKLGSDQLTGYHIGTCHITLFNEQDAKSLVI